MKTTLCLLALAVSMLSTSGVESQFVLVAMSGPASGSTFYYTDFSSEDFDGWTATENIQLDAMGFDGREEMFVSIRPNAEPPGSVSSPAMPFKRGTYRLEISGRCLFPDKTVDVEFFIGDRSIGRSWYAYELSTAKRVFYVDDDMEVPLKITIAGGSSPMLTLAEVIIFGPT